MYRIDDETSATSMPPPEEAGAEGFFIEGDPATGVPATIVRASWLNMVQEELRTIVEAGGLTPTKEANSQVLEALLAKFARRITTASGEADQIIGIFKPVVKNLTNGLSVLLRASLENTSKSPTFQADETEPKEIVKCNDLPLEAGDISGAGHWLELHYDEELDKWVLQNPAISQSSGLPVGGIAYFAMKEAPVGYLQANGAAVGRDTYPGLFAAIGKVFGAGDGETTFNLPDLRGEFVRGWDGGRNVDSGRVFGSAQGDAIRNISGQIGTYNIYPFGQPTGALGITGTSGALQATPVTSTSGSNGFSFDASRIVPTAAENRPRNIALLACIKAFDVAENPGLIDITALANEVAGKAPIVNTIGFGQRWQDVSASRTINTSYTNTTGRPIVVRAGGRPEGSTGYYVLYVDGIDAGSANPITNYTFSISAIVPAGSVYRMERGGADTFTGNKWSELR